MTSCAVSLLDNVGAIACMIASKLRMNAASSIATHPVTVQPLRLAPSVEDGRAKTLEPFENFTPSKDDLNVIALSVKTSTALAN